MPHKKKLHLLKVYKIYYSFFLKYKIRFFLFIVVVLILSILNGIQPYFYKIFVELLPSGDFVFLGKILLIYVGVRILTSFVGILHHWLGDTFLLPAARDARLAIFKKIQELDFAFHLSKSTGSLISTFKRGDGAFFNLFFVLNVDLSQIILSLIITSFFLFQVSWQMAFLMFICFSFNFFIAFFLIKKNMVARKAFNKAEDQISATIVDNMINYETVKFFSKEEHEYNSLKFQFKKWIKKLWAFAYTYYQMDIIVSILGNLTIFFILLIGFNGIKNNTVTIAEYVMVLGYITSFYPKFSQLMRQLRQLSKHDVDLQKYFAALDLEVKVKDPVMPVDKDFVKGEIEFENVKFVYQENGQPALENFSLHVRQGQSIALVGRSGVGKTTVVKLLMRFFDTDSGAIKIDDVNIKEFSKSTLRSFIGIVPQDPIFFNKSIADNVAYGYADMVGKKNSVSQAEIMAAIKMANLYDFVSTLPLGLKTVVGERGMKLSGGQKQRLAIARMILANPDIIVFDEATSQLDSESEKIIQDAFWKATKNKTTIIIAHRLSTVVKADKIVVMEKGQIREIGSHHELLAKADGVYKKFWDLQRID